MKNYTYNGLQASFAIRTTAGVLTLQHGITANVVKELHQAAKKHPIVQALIKTGELTVTGEFAPEQDGKPPNPLQDHTATDAVKASAITAADAEQAKAANPDPAIHSLNGATVIDEPVTTQLTSTPAAPENNDAPAPAADSPAETATNAEPAPKPPTIPQLKKQLDELGIKYEAKAIRDELVALLPKQD